jgi:hypothetical protein
LHYPKNRCKLQDTGVKVFFLFSNSRHHHKSAWILDYGTSSLFLIDIATLLTVLISWYSAGGMNTPTTGGTMGGTPGTGTFTPGAGAGTGGTTGNGMGTGTGMGTGATGLGGLGPTSTGLDTAGAGLLPRAGLAATFLAALLSIVAFA